MEPGEEAEGDLHAEILACRSGSPASASVVSCFRQSIWLNSIHQAGVIESRVTTSGLRAFPLLRRVGKAALDLLYPPRCALCGHYGSFLCSDCLTSLPPAAGQRCNRCWLPLAPHARCRRCRERPLAFDWLRSAFRYDGGARELVHAFKFRGQSAIAAALAGPIIESLATAPDEPDLIVPVPLAGGRQRERGYNQASLLARAVADRTGLRFLEALRRTRSGPAQSRSASAAERFENVRGAFVARSTDLVTGARVLVIDDVATTGATLDACATVLLAAGAASVAGATFARED